jgi:hypothetical protein
MSLVARLGLALSMVTLSAGTAFAGPATMAVDAGDVAIYDANDPEKVLERGDSATVFGLRLPPGAECPGDSRNDGWRVQGFIVPSEVAMGDVEWTVVGATGVNQSALFRSQPASIFVHELTIANNAPGQPGRIPDPPYFTFAWMQPNVLAPGVYRIGIGCTLNRELDRYWDADIVVDSDDSVQPGGIRWRLPGASPEGPGSGLSIPWLAVIRVGAVMVAVGSVGYLLFGQRLRRRRDTAPDHQPEPSTVSPE